MLNASPQRGRKAALESGDGVRTLPLSFFLSAAKTHGINAGCFSVTLLPVVWIIARQTAVPGPILLE